MQCTTCNSQFEITEKEFSMLDKLWVEAPTQCIFCRWQQLLSFWPSIGKWYKRKCDFSGETIVTNYPINARFPVYQSNYFDGDGWDSVGLTYDSSKPFFDQFKELQEKTPRPHMIGINSENCDYCDDSRNCKDCFLSSSILDCEKIHYSYRNLRCNHCVDITYSFDCENCYDILDAKNCYKLFFSSYVENCSNSSFLYDCRNCKDCFMCWNLRDKKYCIRNKQYTKEEYKVQLAQIDLWSRQQTKSLKTERETHIKQDVYQPATVNISCEKCEGNHLQNSKELTNSFFIQESEDCTNIFRGLRNKNCLDSVGILNCENIYGSTWTELFNTKYCMYSVNCRDSEYIDNCQNCSNCFGCVGLRNKEYCVLNVQYSQEQYIELISRIKNDMTQSWEYGQLLPYSMMYTWYNTTIARFYFPKTKEEILALWWYREDEVINSSNIKWFQAPDHIKDIPKDIHKKTIICAQTGQAFNFVPQVIKFHQKHNIALPGITHLQRTINRFKPLTNIKTFDWVCAETWENIVHYYLPEWWYEKIVSREWYDKNIDW